MKTTTVYYQQVAGRKEFDGTQCFVFTSTAPVDNNPSKYPVYNSVELYAADPKHDKICGALRACKAKKFEETARTEPNIFIAENMLETYLLMRDAGYDMTKRDDLVKYTPWRKEPTEEERRETARIEKLFAKRHARDQQIKKNGLSRRTIEKTIKLIKEPDIDFVIDKYKENVPDGDWTREQKLAFIIASMTCG